MKESEDELNQNQIIATCRDVVRKQQKFVLPQVSIKRSQFLQINQFLQEDHSHKGIKIYLMDIFLFFLALAKNETIIDQVATNIVIKH